MNKIGIFWVHKNAVLGKARDPADGEQRISGILDSPDTHVHVWEDEVQQTAAFPELRDMEYQDVPRGRVVYAQANKKTTVYMDKCLHTPATKRLVASFFGLKAAQVEWKTDQHYTTDPRDIAALFEQ